MSEIDRLRRMEQFQANEEILSGNRESRLEAELADLREQLRLRDEMLDEALKDSARRVNAPQVVCLCGSTRFTNEMLLIKWEFEKQGKITLSWNYLPQGFGADSHIAEAEGVKEQIDELHKRKIDISDEVFVVNLNGHIGESTRSEIDYAESIGKPVRYLETYAAIKESNE
jgi:acetolactate synthase small subunit